MQITIQNTDGALAEALSATAHKIYYRGDWKATATPFPTEGAKFAYRTLPVIKIHIKSPFASSSEMNQACGLLLPACSLDFHRK
jgi:hypothetical protein